VKKPESAAAAAAHGVDLDRWRAGFDEVLDRVASRFVRCETLRNARALMLGLVSDLGAARPQAGVDVAFTYGQGGGNLSVLDVRVIEVLEAAHFVFPSSDSADRNALDVLAADNAYDTTAEAPAA
jgi:hypothetical protein